MTAGTGSPLEGRLALARSATDRAAEHRTDDAWLAAAWADPRTRVLRIADGRTLVDGDRILYCAPEEAPEGERYFLGVDDQGAAFFAVAGTEPAKILRAPLGSGAVPAGLREVGARLDDRDAGLLVLAVGLANWHATHQHCPRCGTPTEVAVAGFVRRCPADASEHYPRTDPAIIVLVSDVTGERCLLGSSARWSERRFSTLAGFVEPGESLEAAVLREVFEESGIRVTDPVYLGSQPWPFPASLMLGFMAKVDPNLTSTLTPDGAEILDLRWFTRDELRSSRDEIKLPGPTSIAHAIIEEWFGEPITDGMW